MTESINFNDRDRFFPGVRDTTRSLLLSVFYDQPLTPGAIVDYGLDSPDHYRTLAYAIQVTDIHPMEVDEMLGDGKKLTQWVTNAVGNPKGVVFKTSWDEIYGRTVEEPEAKEPQPPTRHAQRDRERER